MKLIWYTVLIRAIPETLGLILLTLAVVNERKGFKETLLTSIVCGLVGFSMRMLPLKFGIHAILVVIIEAIIINAILKVKLQKAFLGILASLAVLTVTEIITFAFIESVLKLNSEAVFSSAVGTLLAGLPSVLMLYLIALIINSVTSKRNFKESKGYVGQ